MTLRLASLYGTGDTYLVCSLLRAAERHHARPAELMIKSSHVGIPEMFGLEYRVDNEVRMILFGPGGGLAAVVTRRRALRLYQVAVEAFA